MQILEDLFTKNKVEPGKNNSNFQCFSIIANIHVYCSTLSLVLPYLLNVSNISDLSLFYCYLLTL